MMFLSSLMSLLATTFSLAIASHISPRQVETILIDLNGDKRNDTITLTSTLPEESFFNTVTISLNGFKKQSFVAKNGWTTIDSFFLLNNKNSCKSNRIFVSVSKTHSTILLFGELSPAGYREDFSIVNLKNDDARMVFDQKNSELDIETPIKLADMDNDGKTDFVFTEILQYSDEIDSLDAHLGTYSPFYVYTIDDDFKLNKPITKQYNERNYVFAGYEYNEQIKVLYPRDGSKPRIFKEK